MIVGKPDTIAKVKKLPTGDPSNLVNFDAIERLPEMLSGVITEVRYTKDDWEDVGSGNFMPSPGLVNKICEARGIFGTDGGTSEPITMEVDWNRLCCKFDDGPKMVKMVVGYVAKKTGKVMTEDGSFRTSDECVVSYNAWERLCADAWGKEEAATDYYSPSIVKVDQSGSKYYESTWNGKVSKRYLKYDTRAKRQQSLDAELKFAQRKADTKARNVVIRVITGMDTGYSEEALKEGVFYFHRIQKSEFAIKMEQAARMQRLASPDYDPTREPSSLLYAPAAEKVAPRTEPTAPAQTAEPVQPTATAQTAPELVAEPSAIVENVDQRLEMIRILSAYKDVKAIPDGDEEKVNAVLLWLGETLEPEKNEVYWKKAMAVLSKVESAIPENMRIKGDLIRC